jgi:hypothetical protein
MIIGKSENNLTSLHISIQLLFGRFISSITRSGLICLILLTAFAQSVIVSTAKSELSRYSLSD